MLDVMDTDGSGAINKTETASAASRHSLLN